MFILEGISLFCVAFVKSQVRSYTSGAVITESSAGVGAFKSEAIKNCVITRIFLLLSV